MRREKQEKLEQLSKILQSHTFQGSESLKIFLKYIVNAALQNQSTDLKEYTIANDVFGNTNYDPRIDSTVRVQAGRLRVKLQEYYETEGVEDRWVIELPKGHYVPAFRIGVDRQAHLPIEPPGPRVQPYPGTELRPLPSLTVSERTPSPNLNWLVLLLGLAALGAILMAFSYRSESLRLQASLPRVSMAQSDFQTLSGLWGHLLRSSRPILVVYSNTLFGRGSNDRLNYLTPLEPSDAPPDSSSADRAAARATAIGANLEVIDHYTGIGEVMAVASLSRMFTQVNQAFRVKRSLLLAWDDVKTENIVILGSPHENYFLRKLPQRQNFVFEFDPPRHAISIVNQRPLPGEAKSYSPKIERPRSGGLQTVSVVEDYALVSLLRGLGENNRLLILAGTTTFATHAAAEYVSNPVSVAEFLERLKGNSGAVPQSFEAVLKVVVNDGVPVQTTYLTHHPVGH
jgi:hypothetical protein